GPPGELGELVFRPLEVMLSDDHAVQPDLARPLDHLVRVDRAVRRVPGGVEMVVELHREGPIGVGDVGALRVVVASPRAAAVAGSPSTWKVAPVSSIFR